MYSNSTFNLSSGDINSSAYTANSYTNQPIRSFEGQCGASFSPHSTGFFLRTEKETEEMKTKMEVQANRVWLHRFMKTCQHQNF